jgi:Complex I intermediate-associated protein 30 (CIA30)
MMWQQLRSSVSIQLARWKRRIQLRSQLAVLNWTVPDSSAGYPPLTLFDARRDGAGIVVGTPSHPSSSSATPNASATQQQQQDHHLQWWKAADDRAIGGFSSASVSYPYPLHYIRWSGTVDTTVGLTSRVHRSGYCAIHSDHDLFHIDLQGNYKALEITARAVPSHWTFTVNLTVHSSIPEDLYQGELRFDNDDDTDDANQNHDGSKTTITNNNASSSTTTTTTTKNTTLLSDLHHELDRRPFRRFVLPFGSFRVTSRGRDRHVVRRLDDRVQLERFGLLVVGYNKQQQQQQQGDNGRIITSASSSGPFALDIARIRAVNLSDDDDDDNNRRRRWRGNHNYPHQQRRTTTVIGDDLDDDIDNDNVDKNAADDANATNDADQPRDNEIISKKDERPPEPEGSRSRSQ